MTDEQVFQTLVKWSMVFGCDVYEGEREENETRRGLFRKLRRPGQDEEMQIVIQTDLPLEEKIEVMAHEIGHLALSLLKVEPYQKLTHEPTASLFAKCLVAVIREDFGNPLFRISGMSELVKQFLELLKGKIDRTSKNLAMMEVAYLRWKEVEGNGTIEGDRG